MLKWATSTLTYTLGEPSPIYFLFSDRHSQSRLLYKTSVSNNNDLQREMDEDVLLSQSLKTSRIQDNMRSAGLYQGVAITGPQYA